MVHLYTTIVVASNRQNAHPVLWPLSKKPHLIPTSGVDKIFQILLQEIFDVARGKFKFQNELCENSLVIFNQVKRSNFNVYKLCTYVLYVLYKTEISKANSL